MASSTHAKRLDGLGTTIFAEMSALAVRTGSINLGQGFPDSDGPAEVADAAVAALRAGLNQYTPGSGTPELRAAIAAHQARFYGIDIDPDTQVLITVGATEAIAACALSLVDPGDEVVMFEPYYDSYAATIAMAGGVRRVVPLRDPDWSFDIEDLRSAVGPRCRYILLNTPHNPTGKVFTPAELQAIADIAIERDVLVVSDEVYEHLAYDDIHRPISSIDGMAERTLTISSGGKTFSCTGWKIGWVTGPRALVDAVRTSKQFISYVNGGPFQYGIAAGLGLGDDYFDQLRSSMIGCRDLLAAGLSAAGLTPLPAAGGYFLTTDVASIGETDAREFCLGLPARAGLVAIPSTVFYDDADRGRTMVRWAFCKRPELLQQANEALGRLRVDKGEHI